MSVSRDAKDRFHTKRKPEARENGSGPAASFRMRLAALIGGVALIAPLAVLGGIAPAVAAPGDYEVTDSVEVGYSPEAVAVDTSTNTVYVVNDGDYQAENRESTLTVINGADNAVIATVALPGVPRGIAVDEETHAVYVGNDFPDALSVIDPALGYAVVASIPVGNPDVLDAPWAVAVDADSHTVYVANYVGDSVSVIDYSGPSDSIDPDAFSLVTNVTVGNGPWDIAVNSTTNTIYTANAVENTVTVLNGADNTVTESVIVADNPSSVAVDEDLNTVYSAGEYESKLTVVDASDNSVITTLDLSDVAYDVAVDASTHTVYAALEGGILAVIDGTTNTQTTSIDVGTQVEAVAVNEVTHASYVIAPNDEIVPGTLWVISGASPATAPAAPTIGTATAGDAEATVTFTPPTDDGGSAITEYTVTATDVTTPANGGQTVTGAAGPITVSGLTNGDTYTFTVSATNSVGVGPESDPSNEVVPATVPGAPTIGVATAGDSEATLTFTPPADNGGAEITGYTVTAINLATAEAVMFAAAGSPVTVTGLTNGDTYTFTVSATNSVGTGPYSAASNPVIPLASSTVPGAPLIGEATAGDAEATVTFTAPTDDGGSAITEYTVTATDVTTPANGGQTVTGAAGPITVPGLTNGDTYTFTVSATNSVGTGPESAPSNEVTPATVPGAPLIGVATAGDSEATLTFTAPADNGGAAITGYTVTARNVATGINERFAVTGSPATVTGLTNGATYTLTVSATNRVGTGPESAASNEVTPTEAATVPAAPTIGVATAGDAEATVTFTAPTDDGGAAITEYAVTATDATTPANGGQTATGAAGPITVPGLTNGDTYTFTVSATNSVGTGAESAPSNEVVPATTPGAPEAVTATAGDAEATVTFTPPTDDGGAEITEYTVTATDVTTPANGGQTVTGAAGPITVPGLTNGDTYTFTVSATNRVGTGPESAASNEATPLEPATVPGAPTIGEATAGNAEATVIFTPPTDDGGAAITEYTVTATEVTTAGAGGKTSATTLDSVEQLASGMSSPITVTGLTNGVTYTLTVSATNSVGTGPESAPSNEVTPATTPGAPVIGTATAGNAEATVTFTPPTDDGGAEITEYTVTATDATTPGNGGQTVTGTSGPITVTGLTNGDTYTFTVSATNRVGTGPESAASNTVTPVAPTVPVEPVTPVTPVTPVNPVDPGLAATGPDLTVPLGLVGLLLAAGVALLVVTSRGRSKEQFTR